MSGLEVEFTAMSKRASEQSTAYASLHEDFMTVTEQLSTCRKELEAKINDSTASYAEAQLLRGLVQESNMQVEELRLKNREISATTKASLNETLHGKISFYSLLLPYGYFLLSMSPLLSLCFVCM